MVSIAADTGDCEKMGTTTRNEEWEHTRSHLDLGL